MEEARLKRKCSICHTNRHHTKAWSDKTTKEFKVLKGLKKENLRDSMTNTELILNMLAEASTKDISATTNPDSFEDSKKVAKQGGYVAKVARKELEAKTGLYLSRKRAIETYKVNMLCCGFFYTTVI